MIAILQFSAVFNSRAIRRSVSPKSEAYHIASAQIYRDLYGDAMLVPMRMGTNMAAGNQQKHLSLSFATKA